MILALRSDFFWVFLGRFSAALIAIANLRIMTTLLDPGEFGIYALLISFQGLFGLMLINPLGQHINRRTHAWWDDGTLFKRLRGYNHYLVAVAACGVILIIFWWLFYLDKGGGVTKAIISAAAVSGVVYLGTWNGTFVYILNMLGFRKHSTGWMVATSIISLSCSSYLASVYESSGAWLIGQAIGMAFGAAGAGLFLRKRMSERERSRESGMVCELIDRKTILNFCLPLSIATGFLWVQNTGYRFWVGSEWGVAELGIMALGLNISSQLWGILEALSMQFLSPYFFRHITKLKSNKEKSVILSDFVNIMWPVYAIFASFNIVLASSLLLILTDARYHTAVTFVSLGVIIEFARCTSNLWSYASQIERRTKNTIWPYGAGAFFVFVGAALVFETGGGIDSLAMVLVISRVITCLVMVGLMQKMIRVKVSSIRWMAGFSIFIIGVFLSIFYPISVVGMLNNIALVLSVGLITGLGMLAVLWKSPALNRMMSISLQG